MLQRDSEYPQVNVSIAFDLDSSKKKLFVNEYGTVTARQKGKVLLKTKINGKWVKN
jgi:hypothetical protein